MSWARENFIALDHVQVAMPAGGEARARDFYVGVLGMSELPSRPRSQRAAARGSRAATAPACRSIAASTPTSAPP